MTATTADDLACQELVELVTDYLEGALPATTHARLIRHLAGCPDCATYVEQVRTTVRLAGEAGEGHRPSDAERQRLLDAFRGWHGVTR